MQQTAKIKHTNNNNQQQPFGEDCFCYNPHTEISLIKKKTIFCSQQKNAELKILTNAAKFQCHRIRNMP